MDVSQKTTLSLAAVLGAGVLASYVPIARDQMSGAYDYWMGIPKNVQYMMYGLMLLAAVGFVLFIVHFSTHPVPTQGLFSYSPVVVPLLVGLLLVSAVAWSVCVMLYVRNPSPLLKVMCAVSLIVTAVCGLLLLAGYVESGSPKWYVVLGLLLFCTVTVLCDGVAWNSKLILHQT